MFGVIILLVALLVVMPIGIMMSGAGLSALIAGMLKTSVDKEFVGTEDLEISEANPYHHP